MQDTKLPVNILFKEVDDKSVKLQSGTMTMEELYASNSSVWVTNAAGDGRLINRRDFHIVDPTPFQKRRAIVCDVDGILNYIPKTVAGTSHRDSVLLQDGTVSQWTALNRTLTAEKNTNNFRMIADLSKAGYELLFLTARGDTQRVVTERFLREGLHEQGCYEPFTTFMRGFSANDIAAPELKAMQMQACILPYYNIAYFIDDCPKNIALMRQTCPEVPCMHIIY